MRNRQFLTSVLALGLAMPLVACGEDDMTVNPGPQPTPSGGPAVTPVQPSPGGSLHDMVPEAEWGTPNINCPEHPPYSGKGAPRGACCYRYAPNSKIVQLPSQQTNPLAVTEYRLNYQVTTNHPNSIGLPTLIGLALDRGDNHEWNMLWRFEQPRMNGQWASGDGYFWVGWGAYNCDGTYSHYGPTAAPTNKTTFEGATMADRWEVRKIPATFDATQNDINRMTVAFEESNVGRTYTPFLNADTFELEWELIAQGFTIDSFDFSDAGLDCQGVRTDTGEWTAGGVFRSYTVVGENHFVENGIPTLGFQTFSQLAAFGLLGEERRNMLDPTTTERCEPQLELPADQRTCPWLKLPTSLCPTNDAERALYGCHVGWEANPDGHPTNCTATAPTTARDDSAPDEGQCCDPLGRNGLPECNAWLLLNEFVAAAAEITDSLAGAVDTKCEG